MKTLKQFRTFAVLCLAIVSLTSWANDDIISGSCGDNLTYRLDRYGTLTISGTGAMNNTRPWKDYSDVITRLIIEEGVTSIAELAFYNCKIVNYVSIPESMTSIGSYAFEDCGQYKAYFCCLAKTMPTMGSSVFGSSSIFNRYEYSTLIVPESALNAYKSDSQWKVFGNIQAHNASGLIAGSCGDNVNYRLDYDGTLTISGTGAMTDYDIRTAPWYNNNSDISAIQVSDGVTHIGSYAFYGSNALSATLGADVASIGDRAFYNCQDLTSITCQATGVPTTGSELFRNVPQSNIVLYVPAASVEAYKAASWCSEFSRTLPIGYPHVIAGHCGDHLSYELDSDGTLFIHGSSAMLDYNATTQPWKNQRGQIQTVELSSNTYSIGAYAFSGCTSLTKVVCPSKSIVVVGNHAFDNVPLSSATLYVLPTMLDSYKASEKWGVFGTILPIGSDTPEPDPTPIPAEPESVELTGESIVGQWNIVHVKTQKYLNGSLYKDDEETTAAPYDRIDFTLSTITYMEYSSSSNTWHQDMKGSYLLEGNKLVFNKDDYSWNDGSVIVYFVVSAYNGQNQMEITIRTDDENYDGSGSTRNTITTLTLERSTNPAFDSEPEGIELTGESIVGQWNIVSAKIKNYRDNVFTEEKSESFTAPYDRFDFTENTIMFMEHSSSSNGWHEDGKGTYRMEGNKLVYNKDGDFVFFVITAYDGQNSMEVVSRYDESKSGILYSEVATCVLERNTGGSNPEDDPGEEEDEEAPEPSGIDINGINYTFYDSYAEVQYREGKYSGELTIPHTVYRDGRYYEVRSIGEKAFFHCDQLYKIIIPDGVYEIKASAFKGCTSLREVIIGTGLYYLQSKAFAGCTALKDFTIFNPDFNPDNQNNNYSYTE
ncbi:MAG: leucine-rich repeat protein, partial [Prevotella sp.]|nr:leucine-rich repeat protein [Prevotella sp.]